MKYRRIVLKFGGKSLATVEQVHQVKNIILDHVRAGEEIVVVVSAMGSMTDELIALAHQVTLTPAARELDLLISVGERISMTLLTMALLDAGVDAVSFTGSQSGIVTTNDFTEAKILRVAPERIIDALKQKKVVVVAGFQGVSQKKEVTTLGRGGSDTTAVALAIALQADKALFYKDVDGLYTENPHLSDQGTFIAETSYEEAYQILEKEVRPLLHLRALTLAQKRKMPLEIRSFVNPLFQKITGTVIRDKMAPACEINLCETNLYEVSEI